LFHCRRPVPRQIPGPPIGPPVVTPGGRHCVALLQLYPYASSHFSRWHSVHCDRQSGTPPGCYSASFLLGRPQSLLVQKWWCASRVAFQALPSRHPVMRQFNSAQMASGQRSCTPESVPIFVDYDLQFVPSAQFFGTSSCTQYRQLQCLQSASARSELQSAASSHCSFRWHLQFVPVLASGHCLGCAKLHSRNRYAELVVISRPVLPPHCLPPTGCKRMTKGTEIFQTQGKSTIETDLEPS